MKPKYDEIKIIIKNLQQIAVALESINTQLEQLNDKYNERPRR